MTIKNCPFCGSEADLFGGESVRYRKKPIVVEAFKLGDGGWSAWFHNAVKKDMIWSDGEDGCYIRTLEGNMHAIGGDYIIRGIKGEIYPCKPDIFAATYEPVEGPGGGE